MSFYQKKKRILWYKRLEADTAQKILFKIHYDLAVPFTEFYIDISSYSFVPIPSFTAWSMQLFQLVSGCALMK